MQEWCRVLVLRKRYRGRFRPWCVAHGARLRIAGLGATPAALHSALRCTGASATIYLHRHRGGNAGVTLAFAEFSAARRSRDPAIRFTRALNFEASVVRTLLQPVRLLAPLHGSDRALPSQRKLLHPGFRWVEPARAGNRRTICGPQTKRDDARFCSRSARPRVTFSSGSVTPS
jgi:hypothetical protein